jgi:hypothetical protein
MSTLETQGRPTTLDRIEKGGRLVLWLSLASACLIAPIEYARQHRAEVEMQEARRKADDEREKQKADEERKTKEATGENDRLTLASMGAFLRRLDYSTGEGHVYFTNVSPRAGYVCLVGSARNNTTKAETTSLASCQHVAPYGSGVTMAVNFAGGELRDTCPNGNASCDFNFVEAPQASSAPASKLAIATP